MCASMRFTGKYRMKRLLAGVSAIGLVVILRLLVFAMLQETSNDIAFTSKSSPVDPLADGIRRDFSPTLSDTQRRVLEKSVRALIAVLHRHRVPYHMCGGTLIGSYLNHGMIPWDDDIDICVLVTDTPLLLRALNDAEPEFTYVKTSSIKLYKFFSRNGSTRLIKRRKKLKYRVPYVDICPYGEDNDTIWDMNDRKKRFNKSVVFPLARRPFMNMSLSAPRRTKVYLEHSYDLKHCVTNDYSHIKETGALRKQRRASCEPLHSIYPFVFRSSVSGGTLETLRVGNRTLATVVVDELDSIKTGT